MKRVLSLVLFAILFTGIVFGQVETGQVSGIVSDATGALIAGATVVAHNDDTGLTRTVTSSNAGAYEIVELPAGNYTVKVSAPNFGSFEEKAVIAVGTPLSINVKLGAQANTTIEITADSAVASLNTTTNEVSQLITPEQIANLPSLTRNPYDFAAISGNVTNDQGGGQANGIGYAVGGGRSTGVEILLDGVENINLYAQSVGQIVPLDSVQEYSIITSGFDARYGRATGGVVNLTTKPGTNRFHGSAYEYNRINALAANTYYEDAVVASGLQTAAQVQDHFVRNQFGYSIGGPVFRDKLFFFSNTEWERIRSSGSRSYVIPTASFLATTPASVQAFFQAYGKPRANLQNVGAPISVSGTNKQGAAVNFVNALQQVSFVGPAATVAGAPQNTYFTLNRVDWNISSKATAYFRYGLYSEVDTPGGTLSLTSPYAGYDSPSTAYDQAYLGSLSYAFSQRLVNVAKISFTRDNNATPLGTNPAGPTLYSLGGALKDSTTQQYIALPGYLPLSPGSAIPAGGPENFYEYLDDLEYIRGAHDIHVGGTFEQLRDNRTFGAYQNSVNQLSATGEADAFSNLNVGRLYQFQAAIYPQGELPCASSYTTGAVIQTPQCTLTLPLGLPNFERNNTFNDGSVYGEDTYKIARNVSVTAGLRWEYFGVQHNHNPNLESNFFLGSGTTYQAQFRAGNLATTPNSPVGGLYAQQFHNYAPRFGLAWDVFGDGKYTVRGGYGISYERNYGNVTYNVIQNAPAYGVISLIAIDANSVPGKTPAGDVATLPITNNNFGPLAGNTGSKAFPAISLRPVAQNIKTAYQQNYNLAIAHEVLPGALVELSYAGARGIHLYSIANVNRLYFGNQYLGDSTAVTTRLQSQYSAANMRGANGDSYYNSANLRVEFDRYRSSGLHFTLNYTIAHSLDNNSSTFDSGNASGNSTGFLGYLDPFNPSSSFGNSDFDVRNRIAIGAIYTPAFLNNHGTLLRETVGGITLAPIITAQSGSAFNVWDNSNTDGQAEPNIFRAPNQQFHGTSVFSGTLDKFNYINIPAAAKNTGVNPINGKSDLPCNPQTTAGCTFNKGIDRNQFYGPGNYNVNLGAYKTFEVYKKVKLEVRAEAYNLFNHSNYYVNGGTSAEMTSTNAATGFNITTSKGGSAGGTSNERRQMQLAVRVDF